MTDFIALGSFPVFNLADVAITAGFIIAVRGRADGREAARVSDDDVLDAFDGEVLDLVVPGTLDEIRLDRVLALLTGLSRSETSRDHRQRRGHA